MRIEAVREATPGLHDALARLLPQLNPTLPIPDLDRLRRLLADPGVALLVASDGNDIVGTATVIVFTTPFWVKARIEEVVVDSAGRGKGIGEALVEEAIAIARKRGAQIVELQSARRPERAAAQRLYKRLGFKIRDSDLFRLEL